MTPRTLSTALALLLAATAASTPCPHTNAFLRPAGRHQPVGPKDEIGRLNLITEASRRDPVAGQRRQGL